MVNGILACIPFHTWCREPLLPVFSVCGRSEQCFRSYPRNYTSVWLSAPTPTLRTRYQTLIACHGPPPLPSPPLPSTLCPPFSLFFLPFLPVWPALRPSAFRSLSRRITERHRLPRVFRASEKTWTRSLASSRDFEHQEFVLAFLLRALPSKYFDAHGSTCIDTYFLYMFYIYSG